MPECDHCGATVSQAFHRLYEVDGKLVACHECGVKSSLTRTIYERHEELEALPGHGSGVP